MTHLDDFLLGYVEAMLWANTIDPNATEDDPDGGFWDAHYVYQGPGEWWTDTPVDLADAHAFFRDARNFSAMLLSGQADFSRHGHDFALTRNHHGAGFWDYGYPDAIGQHLTDAAHAYGEAYVYIPQD